MPPGARPTASPVEIAEPTTESQMPHAEPSAFPAMPMMAQSPGLDPSSEIYKMLLRERIVFLGTEVTDAAANVLIAQMLYLEGEDKEKDIWLYINSPGGSVTAGMAIYDTMQFITPDVATICMGLGASMGQFLLCAGAKGKRFSLPHARILMHQPLGGIQGQAADIAIQAEQMKYTKRLMAERIAHHTGQKVEQIEDDSDRDRWFTAEQAMDYGIIDHVIVKRGEIH
jgi:ATP-dependent Clp protease protease subunit